MTEVRNSRHRLTEPPTHHRLPCVGGRAVGSKFEDVGQKRWCSCQQVVWGLQCNRSLSDPAVRVHGLLFGKWAEVAVLSSYRVTLGHRWRSTPAKTFPYDSEWITSNVLLTCPVQVTFMVWGRHSGWHCMHSEFSINSLGSLRERREEIDQCRPWRPGNRTLGGYNSRSRPVGNFRWH